MNNAAIPSIPSTPSTPLPSPYPLPTEPVIQLMANIINYLNASLYESQFTHKHEQSRASLNLIYDAVSAAPTSPPSLDDCAEFYRSMHYLTGVTYTDDPDYYTYKKTLLCHVRALERNQR